MKKAEGELSGVYKIIDTCAKKNILPNNRANRMKSKAQKSVSPKAK